MIKNRNSKDVIIGSAITRSAKIEKSMIDSRITVKQDVIQINERDTSDSIILIKTAGSLFLCSI